MIDRALEVVNGGASLSVAAIVKVNVPAALGVPLIVPLVERVKPVGSEPLASDH